MKIFYPNIKISKKWQVVIMWATYITSLTYGRDMVWSITDMFFYTSLACYLSALAYPSSEIIGSYLL